MATRKKKVTAKRGKGSSRLERKRRTASAKKTRARKKSASRSTARASEPDGGAASVGSERVPPPISGVPRDQVGQTVQRFISWDEVRELEVVEDGDGTFRVTPVA